MPDTLPLPEDPTVKVIDDILNALIYGAGVTAAIEAAISDIPFLAWPIINSLFTYFVNKIADMIYKPLEKAIAFQVIHFKTKEQQDQYDAAVANLKAAQISGDPNVINQVTEDLKKKLADLIHFPIHN